MIMIKADVGSVRRAVSKHIGSKVVIRSNLGRHRVDVTEGIIMDTYPSIFLISVKNGFEDYISDSIFQLHRCTDT